MATQKEFESRPEILALPSQIRQKLIDFIYVEIPKARFFKPNGKPNKEWKIFYGDSWDSALNFALDAAWESTRGSVWAPWALEKRSPWDSAMASAWTLVWDATWGLERESARIAVRAAARDSASEFARDSGWDAALYSDYILVGDLRFKGKENGMAHAKARWEVWQKGYGLLCDIDGVLYVYAVKSKTNINYKTDK